MRRYPFLEKFACLPLLMFAAFKAMALEVDRDIYHVRLFDESFLDISANAFRKSQNVSWFDTTNGLRMGGGSSSTDRLFLQSELRLNHRMSDSFNFGLELEQNDFYAKKPVQQPILSIDAYPFSSTDVGFSFLGTTSVHKKDADLGVALTLGRRYKNYIRLSWLSNNHYYNEKNDTDDSYYTTRPKTWMLQSAYRPSQHWQIYLNFKNRQASDFVFDDQVSRFKNEFYDYKATVNYHLNAHQFAGVEIHTLLDARSILETSADQIQDIRYRSVDLYWVSGVGQAYELTVGLRHDDFVEEFTHSSNAAESYNFQLQTTQAYTSVYHDISTHQAWDIGLYAGWSERRRIYPSSTNADSINEGVQAKLRTSWEYHSADKKSRMLFSFSLNLDDLADDPTDGGGITFQSSF